MLKKHSQAALYIQMQLIKLIQQLRVQNELFKLVHLKTFKSSLLFKICSFLSDISLC